MSQIFIELQNHNSSATLNIVANKVFAVYFSMAAKSTHVVSDAGGVVPVAETVDEVKERLAAALTVTEGESQ